MPSLTRFFTHRPRDVERSTYRSFVVLNAALVAAIGIHLVVTGVFAALGAWALVAFNAFSLAAYSLGLRVIRRSGFLSAVGLALLELLLHQALCVRTFGLEPGFQFYLLCLPATIFFLPPGRTLVKVGMLLASIGGFVAIHLLGRIWAPWLPLSDLVATTLYCFNVSVVFLFLGIFAYAYALAAEIAEGLLRDEHRRSGDLLRAILPAPVADRMVDRRQVIADALPQVAVAVADLDGFHGLSARMPPGDQVALLNDVFADLDALAERYGLERIKTLGDAYLVAAGAPVALPDPMAAMADWCLEAQATMARRVLPDGRPLTLRIGVAFGPVFAGVIGTRKFIYDLWGDTVRAAFRLEREGEAGRVLLGPSARRALGDRYVCEAREATSGGPDAAEAWFLVRGHR